MLTRILRAIDETELTIKGWILSFGGILLVRFFFESYSSPPSVGGVTINFLTGIHYALFFTATFFMILMILCLLAPDKRRLSLKVSLYGMLLILLAPILDLILTAGKGSPMVYLFDADHGLLFNFFTFNFTNGATVGLQIEIAIIIIVIGACMWNFTRSWIKSIGAALLAYLSIFICGSLPAIIAMIGSGHALSSVEFTNFYLFSIKNSVLIHTLIEPMYMFKNIQGFFGTFFNSVVGQFFLIVTLTTGSISLILTYPEKWRAVVRNSRPERLLYYLSLVTFGIAIAYHFGQAIIWNWVDVLSLITLLGSVKCAWLSSLFLNDVADAEIDAISNPERPIPSAKLSAQESQGIGIIFLVISYVAAFLVGTTFAFLIILFSALSYIYSYKPLRLKRIFPLNAIIMAIAGVSIILLGFFFISSAQNMQAFPALWLTALFVFLLFICPVRDIKDIEGDSKEGIKTLPVIFGEKRGRQITAILAAIAVTFIFPLLLNDLRVFVATLPLGLLSYNILTTKKHPERGAFSVFFVLMILLVLYLFNY
jgi:chlorophyll synthase